jgi:hypothetical protein
VYIKWGEVEIEISIEIEDIIGEKAIKLIIAR